MSELERHPWLRALGKGELPEQIELAGRSYARQAVLKHDFFAATGLYADGEDKVVLKVGRTADLFGFPTAWLGRLLAQHEALLYEKLHDLAGVPGFLGRWGATGFVHEYVEGHPLARNERVPDDFFSQLAELLEAIHRRQVAYVDMEKRENILVGDDGRPLLIDFQISWFWRPERGGNTAPARLLLKILQSSDRYHLMKHYRRHRPDLLTPEQLAAARRRPIYIDLHRVLFRPWTLLRRQTLRRLLG